MKSVATLSKLHPSPVFSSSVFICSLLNFLLSSCSHALISHKSSLSSSLYIQDERQHDVFQQEPLKYVYVTCHVKWQSPPVAVVIITEVKEVGLCYSKMTKSHREEVGVVGWVNKTQDLNSRDRGLFPVTVNVVCFLSMTTIIPWLQVVITVLPKTNPVALEPKHEKTFAIMLSHQEHVTWLWCKQDLHVPPLP